MVPGLKATIAGLAGTAIFFFLWINAIQDLATERERCNTDKLAAVAEAERVTREAEREALQARLAALEQMVEDEQKAREIADQARIIAENRTSEVRTVIREVSNADPSSCFLSLCLALSLTACGTTRVVEKPVPVEIVRTERVPVPADLLTPVPRETIPESLSFAQALELWQLDRESVEKLNGRLRAIQALQ